MVNMNQDVMSTRHYKCFSSHIHFQTVNPEYLLGKIIENLDNSEDGYKGYIQKIMILQVIQQFFCEMSIRGKKTVNTDIYFEVTNIRTNVRTYSS